MADYMTITEIIRDMKACVDVIKLILGSVYGSSIVKDIKAHLTQASIMFIGGVRLEDVHEWINNGCVAVGVGGKLIEDAKLGIMGFITETARTFLERVEGVRGEK